MLADATGNQVEDISHSVQHPREPALSRDIVKEATLSERLQIIFGLSKTETLHGGKLQRVGDCLVLNDWLCIFIMYQEWSCCMVRSAIVPGTLYLTERHICFYASLPQNPVSIEQGWGGELYAWLTTRAASSMSHVVARLSEDWISFGQTSYQEWLWPVLFWAQGWYVGMAWKCYRQIFSQGEGGSQGSTCCQDIQETWIWIQDHYYEQDMAFTSWHQCSYGRMVNLLSGYSRRMITDACVNISGSMYYRRRFSKPRILATVSRLHFHLRIFWIWSSPKPLNSSGFCKSEQLVLMTALSWMRYGSRCPDISLIQLIWQLV